MRARGRRRPSARRARARRTCRSIRPSCSVDAEQRAEAAARTPRRQARPVSSPRSSVSASRVAAKQLAHGVGRQALAARRRPRTRARCWSSGRRRSRRPGPYACPPWASRLRRSTGIDAERVERWFADNVDGVAAAARLRADLRRTLEPDLRRHRRRRARAGRCAARRSASGSPRRTTWAASTGSSRRSARHRGAGAAGRRALRGRGGQRRALLRDGRSSTARSCAERADAERFPDEADRRAIGERVVDTLVAIHAVDPDAVGLGELAQEERLRRPPAAPLAGPMGEVEARASCRSSTTSTPGSRRGSPSRARRRSSTATTASTT